MKRKSGPGKVPAEQVLKDIRRQTRRQYSAEEKIRIVLEGLRGEENISELCRREGIAASGLKRWPTIAHDRTASGIASRTMSAARSSTWRWSCRSCRRGNWRCGSPTSGSTSCRKLQSTGC